MPRTRNCASSSSSGLPGSVEEETYKEIFGEYEHTIYNGIGSRSDNLLESSWPVADGFQPGTNKGNAQLSGSNKLSGPTSDEHDESSAIKLHGVATPKKGFSRPTGRKSSKPNPFDVWMGYFSPPRKTVDGFGSSSADSRSSSDECETASHTGTSSDPFSLPSPDQCLTPGAFDEDDSIFVKGGLDVYDSDDIIRQICGDYNAHGCSDPVECLRNLTPGLFTSQSTSRALGRTPSACSNGRNTIIPPRSNKSISSCSNVDDQQNFRSSDNALVEDDGLRSRKRRLAVDDHIEASQTTQIDDVIAQDALLPKIGLGKLFDTEFLLHRFGFTSTSDAAQTWPCPFPSIGPTCQDTFSSNHFQRHVRAHWKNFEKEHPGQALRCPWEECTLTERSKKRVKQIGPNESLARHILDKHLKGRGVRCPCGSPIGRAVKDQIVRHLLAPRHEERLAAKREADPNFPDYPSIRNPLLLEEQQAWRDNVGDDVQGDAADDDTDDEKEEGSSKGHKRARHS